jgi:hypothetical protein
MSPPLSKGVLAPEHTSQQLGGLRPGHQVQNGRITTMLIRLCLLALLRSQQALTSVFQLFRPPTTKAIDVRVHSPQHHRQGSVRVLDIVQHKRIVSGGHMHRIVPHKLCCWQEFVPVGLVSSHKVAQSVFRNALGVFSGTIGLGDPLIPSHTMVRKTFTGDGLSSGCNMHHLVNKNHHSIKTT